MSPVTDHQTNRELECVTNKETLNKGWFIQLGGGYRVFSYPLGGNKEDGARHFLEVHRKMIKFNMANSKQGGYVEILHSEEPVVAKK